ncbi:MAG: ECF transporter S component, partial [Peptococcaceae bacterium]|nr:ECF transporter S component [Peptococcaceae bacterium]
GYTVGPIAANKDDLTAYTLAIILACAIKVAGYYVAEALIYGNWVQPVLSVPGNLMQIAVAAVIVLPLAKNLKKALRR